MKYMALHSAEDYGEANMALLHMLSIMESSPDVEIKRMYFSNYPSNMHHNVMQDYEKTILLRAIQ